MRRLTIAAALVIWAAAARATPVQNNGAPQVPGLALTPGDAVAPVRALSLDGKETVVPWSASKLTLVNFWATWCVPCRQEMPELQSLYAARLKDGLQVLGVVVQDRATGDEILKLSQELKVGYPLYWGGPDVEVAWHGIGIVPTTYLVDPHGKIVRKYIGTSPEELAALKKDIDDYLAGRPLGDPYLPPSDPAPASSGR